MATCDIAVGAACEADAGSEPVAFVHEDDAYVVVVDAGYADAGADDTDA